MANINFGRREKKNHIKQKIEISYKKMWDLEFLRLNLGETREGFRKQYDRMTEERQGYEIRIGKLKELCGDLYPKAEAEILMRLSLNPQELEAHTAKTEITPDLAVAIEKVQEVRLCEQRIQSYDNDIAQLKEQMDGTDTQIQGDGGVNQTIEGYRSVIDLLKAFYLKI